MGTTKFRKLNIDLPADPVVNDRPWFVAGLFLAIVFVIITAFAFFKNDGLL